MTIKDIGTDKSRDEILDELHAVKDDIAKRFHYDINAIVDYYLKKQKEREAEGHTYVSRPAKRIQRTGTHS